ncbi:MAG: hypothetical protein JKY60_15130 [Kordiimonadaceae bacterium]|nr:hypothetical protein [Kordiimonadaceae bacterium]
MFDEFGTNNKWGIKHCKGGLVDLEFICQYLMLREGHLHHSVFQPELSSAITSLAEIGAFPPDQAKHLEQAHQFLQTTQSLLRLSVGAAPLSSDDIPRGLKDILIRAGNLPDFDAYEQKLMKMQSYIYKAYENLIEIPATKGTD